MLGQHEFGRRRLVSTHFSGERTLIRKSTSVGAFFVAEVVSEL